MKDIISYGHLPIKELSPHKNKGMEITYIEKGSLEWMVEGETEKVEAGSIFFTLPWQVHGSLMPTEPVNQTWFVLFHLDMDYSTPHSLFNFSKELGFTPQETQLLSSTFASSRQHCFRATSSMRTFMTSLVSELQSAHTLWEAHAKSLLRAVLVELKRTIAGKAIDEEIYTPSEKKVRNLVMELSSNYGHDWTLDSMSEYCGIQRTQLGKLFQKITGSTPMEYLYRIRIEQAKTLLRRTSLKVIDIAYECNYASSQYFANVFKQAVGITPTKYREISRENFKSDSEGWKDMRFRSEAEELQRVDEFSRNT